LLLKLVELLLTQLCRDVGRGQPAPTAFDVCADAGEGVENGGHLLAGKLGLLGDRVEDRGLLRHDDAIELAVYFCCLEALQNAAKHAGNGASAVVRLDEQGDELCFEVADDGVGFEPQAVGRGTGLVNLADRVSAVGGTLAVESAPGKGARIRGRIAVR